ncbi:hypothetical protein JGS39_14705 [Streptomyces sp. P01-B04]|uniref:hypothetical protein n=1 Tax=Streptomyces poriferorum TaxID=2798799 RepID=UPI001C5F023B|nr:hypothetical protein [Streptomyces poriferorum]MBW5250229.1 hypothetical protein [Streptomyces poriferorum]MBW5259793.1 hypothetical protein [Streptomyces poriferorum]
MGKGTDENIAAHDLTGRIALVDAGVAGGNGYGWAKAAEKAGAVGTTPALRAPQARTEFFTPAGGTA